MSIESRVDAGRFNPSGVIVIAYDNALYGIWVTPCKQATQARLPIELGAAPPLLFLAWAAAAVVTSHIRAIASVISLDVSGF